MPLSTRVSEALLIYVRNRKGEGDRKARKKKCDPVLKVPNNEMNYQRNSKTEFANLRLSGDHSSTLQ